MEAHKFRKYLCFSMGWLRGGGVEDTVKMLTPKFAGVGSMEDYYAADTGE